MKSARLTIAFLLSFGAFSAAQATETKNVDGEHKFLKAKKYYGECKHATSEHFKEIRPYIKAFTDMEVMANTVAEPARFIKLMSVVNDPHTIYIMAKCAQEPVMWSTWLRGITDVNKIGRTMMVMMNPMTYANWLAAPFNMDNWKTSASHLDPNKYVKWGVAAVNPQFYTPYVNWVMSVDWYKERLDWLVTPATYLPALANSVLPKMASIK